MRPVDVGEVVGLFSGYARRAEQRRNRGGTMAKNGFKVFDSDMHIMEPPDLWQRYIAPEFRDIAPYGRKSENVRDLGTIFPTDPPTARRTSGTPHKGHNYERNQAIY